MPKEVTPQEENNLNTGNIFDEFVQSHDEVKQIDEKNDSKKGLYDYIKIWNMCFMFLNTILFIALVFLTVYNHFQKKEEREDISFLKPVCSFIAGNTYTSGQECYSVTSNLKHYQGLVSDLESKIGERLVYLMWEVYALNNFTYSRKVNFILNTSQSRLRPLNILKDFDNIKKEFTSSFERSNVTCDNVTIQENTMSMSCDVYSSDWDTSIINMKEGVRSILPGWGTSISRAGSFINFIENHNSGLFLVTDKPNTFTSTKTVEDWPYTQVTKINLSLQYVNPEYLSF